MQVPESFRYVDGDTVHDSATIAAEAAALAARTPAGSTVQLRGASALETIAALAGLDGHAARVELLPAGVEAEPGRSEGFPTRWVIFSSGSTGEPKPVEHELASLARAVRVEDGQRTWGLMYDPSRLAGLAVVLQALGSGSTLVEARHGSIAERVDAMRAGKVTALSATPTLWRQMLQSGRTEGWPLERITLGGEVADQRILDALAHEFPGARITHIFAASETGVAFAVGDGLEGFPVRYLETPPRGVALDVRDGILWVHSPSSSLAGPDGFASTGDVVEIRDGRVHFAGRLSGMANVGGTKVFPEQVERVLRDHPGVADVVVTAKANPFSGQVLIARVLPLDPAAGRELGVAVRRWAAERLSSPAVPAQVVIVSELASSANGKVVRS